jgi:thiol:disulfide interchange protein DsbD
MSKPLGNLASSGSAISSSKSAHPEFQKVTSIVELDLLLEKYEGKKILLDFTAKWCAVCKELDSVTFSDEAVKTKMSEFVLIQADITQNGEEQKNLSAKYGVFGPPAIIFFSKNGDVLDSKTIVGFIEPQEFVKHLESI